MALSVVILAAGKGTRMQSSMPKVLHKLAGKPMVQHAIDAAKQLNPDQFVVVAGHAIEQVRESLQGQSIEIVEQLEQLGTGHAVDQALPIINDANQVLVLYGDVPLIQSSTLSQLIEEIPEMGLSLLTVNLTDPDGYGRIVRDSNNTVVEIVEQKDAQAEQLEICEVNTGILAAKASDLKAWLSKVDNKNAQGEYYLTDTIAMAAEAGGVITCQPNSAMEVEGVNSRQQLAQLERVYQETQAEKLMAVGVTLIDPKRIDIRGELECGQDVILDINTIVEGKVKIASGVIVEANCILRDCVIGSNTHVKANTIIESAQVESDCAIGPFARIRPGTILKQGSFIGNFVETKNMTLGKGSKASHLSYIGDATIGSGVNIGAGVITCNYDGVNKFKTKIEDNAFIGSDSQLIAPVKIGKGATIGAGTTVTKDVLPEELCISRVKQKHIQDWQRPVKKTTSKR